MHGWIFTNRAGYLKALLLNAKRAKKTQSAQKKYHSSFKSIGTLLNWHINFLYRLNIPFKINLFIKRKVRKEDAKRAKKNIIAVSNQLAHCSIGTLAHYFLPQIHRLKTIQ
jgi:hypothetical protein